MFKEIGQFASVLKNLPKIREEMDRLQSRLSQITAEGDAGGGMVKVKANGHMEVTACLLSDEAM
jgi:DNA-binding protein YbaB